MLQTALLIALTMQSAALPRPSETLPPLWPPPNVVVERDDWNPPIYKNCPVPRPQQNERFYVLGFGDGSALANYSIGGTNEETTTGLINIADGPGRVFLVLASRSTMIFRLSGNVDRLNEVVLLSPEAAGITGIDPARVSFGIGNNCSVGSDVKKPYGLDALRSIFGRQPDEIGGYHKLHEWNLGQRGAGTAVDIPRHRPSGSDLEVDMNTYYPGGVSEVESSSLISSGTAERYAVLPGSAGALQLERAGAIIKATEGEIAEWMALAKVRHGERIANNVGRSADVYRVTRRIQLPAHLCGPMALNFLVPSEDFVSGEPCHSNIIATDGRILLWSGHLKSDYPQLEIQR